jgi:hypothetical protein
MLSQKSRDGISDWIWERYGESEARLRRASGWKRGSRGRAVFGLFAVMDFFAIDNHLTRGGDAEAHLVTADAQDRDLYVLTDNQGLVRAAAQN